MAKAFRKNPPEPRLLTKEEACHYLGISVSSFELWMKKGIVPGSVADTKRWDKKAIDVHLDQLSGLPSEKQPPEIGNSGTPANDDDDGDWEDVEDEV